MKKFLLCLMIVSCIFVLAGCGKKKASSSNLFDDDKKDEPVEVQKDGKVEDPKIDTPAPAPTYSTKVVCKQTTSGVDIVFTTTLANSKITNMDLMYTMSLASYSDEQIKVLNNQDFCTTIKNSMTGYTNAFENCHQTISSKTLIITADFAVDRITDSSIRNSTTAYEFKSGMETAGYTCTIE